MLPWIPAAIGAGASLLGGVIGDKSARRESERNYQAQREFATHGIRWKVADAKAAGIHPLYALGASTTGFQPVTGDTGAMGRGVSGAGAAISRHAVERARLENDLLRTELMASRMALARDAAGVPGQAGVDPLVGPWNQPYLKTAPYSEARYWDDRYGDAAFFDVLTLRAIDAIRRSGEWGGAWARHMIDKGDRRYLKRRTRPLRQERKAPRNPAHRRRYPQ